MNLDDFVNGQTDQNDDDRAIEAASNGRFYKVRIYINELYIIQHQDLISSSKYRTIFRGFDNESGCEIAWNVYSLENISKGKTKQIYLASSYLIFFEI